MSGGLFGRTSFYSTTQDLNTDKALKEGAGIGLLRYETEPNYQRTKEINDQIGYLTQPSRPLIENPLDKFKINSISREWDGTYGLNASLYNGLIGKVNDKPFGTQLYFPKAYPNHYYNTRKYAPALSGMTEPAYPI